MQAFTAASPLTCHLWLTSSSEGSYSKQHKMKNQNSHLEQDLSCLYHQIFSCSQHIWNPWSRRQKALIQINRNLLWGMPVSVQVKGKDSSQELHDKFMHCTFKPAAKRAFRYVPASRKSKEQAKKTAEQACCCSWVSTISFKWYSKGIRAKMFQPGNSFTVTSLKVRIGTMVTKTSEMSKRTGQIHHLVFWLVRIKKQQLSHATFFINIGVKVCSRTLNAKKEVNFHQNNTYWHVYIDIPWGP